MASVSRQETAHPRRSASLVTSARIATGGRGFATRVASVIAWPALAVAGAVVVLAAAAAAAGLAVGLGTARAAARLGGGVAARRRRRHETWPAMAEPDTG